MLWCESWCKDRVQALVKRRRLQGGEDEAFLSECEIGEEFGLGSGSVQNVSGEPHSD